MFTADMADYISTIECKYIVRHLLVTTPWYVFVCSSQNVVGGSHPSTLPPFLRHLPTQIESALFLILDFNVGRFRNCAMASSSSASSWARIESMYIRSEGCIDRSTLSWRLVGVD